MKNKNKKFSLLFMVTMIISVFLFPQIALATNSAADEKVKVYLSEPLGAGDEVYHVTSCTKTIKKASIRCTKINASMGAYMPQCQNEKGEIIEGKQIQECLPDAKATRGTGEVTKEAINNCKSPRVLRPLLEQEWALVKCNNEQDLNTCAIKNRVVTPVPDLAMIKQEFLAVGFKDEDIQGNIANIFEVKKCDVGDFYVNAANGHSAFGYVSGSGDLTKFPSELNNECKNINNFMIGFNTEEDMAKPAIICTRGERIASTSGTGLLSKFIGAIYRWAAGIVGIVAVLVMVYSGIQISTGGGGGEGVEAAKKRIMNSIIALAVLFLSGLILYTINPTFFT